MSALAGDVVVIQDEDLIGVLYRGDALGNDDDGGVLQVFLEGLPDGRLCGRVHSGGGVVQNEDSGLAQHGPGDTKPLLLAAGDVGAALGQHGVKPVGEGHDKVVGLGVFGGLDDLFLGGVRTAPEKVFPDGSGEEHVGLKDHADAAAQLLQGVVPHVHPVHQNRAAGDVVEPGDEVDQGGLAGAGTAHNGHKGTGLYGEADVGEHVVAGAGGHIFEGDVLKLHLTLGGGERLLLGVRLIFHRRLGVEHFVDAVGTGLGAGELKQRHSHHHNAHQNLEDIVDEGLQVAQQEALGHHHLAAQIQYRHRGAVHGQHHDGHDGNDLEAYVEGGVHQFVIGLFEFVPLVVFPDKGLDHPNGDQVFLKGVVQAVDLFLHGLKQAGTDLHQNADGQHHQGNDHQQHHGQTGIDGDADAQRGDQHDGSPDQHTQAHVQHHGHGVDIVGHAGDEGGGREPVDVREGEVLHLVKQALTQIGAEALAGKGGVFGAEHAAGHGGQREQEHDSSHFTDIGHVSRRNGYIDDFCHNQREKKFADDLQGDKNGRLNGIPLISLKVGHK